MTRVGKHTLWAGVFMLPTDVLVWLISVYGTQHSGIKITYLHQLQTSYSLIAIVING